MHVTISSILKQACVKLGADRVSMCPVRQNVHKRLSIKYKL